MSGYWSCYCLLFRSKQSGHSLISQCISTQRIAAHWIVCFSDHSLNPRDGGLGKLPDQQFLKYLDEPISHQQTCYIQSHFNGLSSPL